MADTFEARAERRRQTWRGGVAGSFAKMERQDLEFWMQATPAERLAAVWQLNDELALLAGADGATARLQRSVGGVRPRRG